MINFEKLPFCRRVKLYLSECLRPPNFLGGDKPQGAPTLVCEVARQIKYMTSFAEDLWTRRGLVAI